MTLSACETALGRDAGGEGFVGFTQALLMSGTRSVCLSLWKVDDTATALLMQRFYANLLGRRPGLTGPMPKAEALREAKTWLRGLRRAEVLALTAEHIGRHRARQRNQGPPAGRARRRDPRRRGQRPAVRGRRISGPRSCWPATRIDPLSLLYDTDRQTQDKAHHESTTRCVSAGNTDRARDRKSRARPR